MKKTGKRALSLLVSILLLLTMLPRLGLTAAAGDVAVSAEEIITGGTCGKNVSWSLSDTGTLTITGTGSMEGYAAASDAPWYSQRASIKTVTIDSGVTDIGYKAFCFCSSLTSVAIPGTVSTIDGYAFYRCSGLKSVAIPESVTEIGEYAFFECISLTSVTIPKNVTGIGSNAFYGCSRLSSVTFHGSAPTLADSCFGNVTATANYPCNDNTWTNAVKYNYNGNILWRANHHYVGGMCTACGNIQNVLNFGSCGTNLQWQLDDTGTLTITGSGAMADYRSASTTPWSSMRSSILTVEIGHGITAIGEYAFASCANLTAITIPDSVTDIGIFAFKDCKSLTSVDLPKDLTVIRKGTFMRCTSLTSVAIPEGVVEIFGEAEGDENYNDFAGAFQNCTSLTSIRIPKSVTKIGRQTFRDCRNLVSIIIPESVTNIGNAVFETVDTTRSVIFLGPAPNIDPGCFSESAAMVYYPCGDNSWENAIKYNYGGYVTWKAWHTFDGNGRCTQCGGGRELVVSMGDYCGGDWNGAAVKIYKADTLLDRISLYYGHYSDHAIVSYAPDETYRLQWVSGPNDSSCSFVATVNGAVLASGFGEDMSDKKDIYLKKTCDHQYEMITTAPTCVDEGRTTVLCTGCGDSSVSSILPATGHSYVGGICTVCKSIQNIQSIASGTCGKSVRWQLDSMGTLYITGTGPMEDYVIGSMSPWYSRRASIQAVEIGESVTRIGECAFENCTNLTQVTIPKGVITIGRCAFEGCKKLMSVTVPEGVTTIGAQAFFGCESMVSVTIPEGVTTIGQYAFDDCSSLTHITIPKSVTDIEIYTFSGCKGLVEITFHENLKSIGQFALAGCYGLNCVTFLGSAPTFGNWVFSDVTTTVYYPCGDKSWEDGIKLGYQGDITWQENHSYVDDVCTVCQDSKNPNSGNCGTDLRWQLDTSGTLTISGTGSMKNYTAPEEGGGPDTPWYPYRLLITKVVIENGVTAIGEYAFHGCQNLTEVIIPESITTIGKLAFYNCTGLRSITIPKGVTTIGSAAFRRCSNLTSVTIPESVTTIGKIAFFDCTGLRSITIPKSVTTIGEYAFGNCTELTTITFLGTAPSIDSTCFKNVIATAIYPCNGKTWTDGVKQNYSGQLTWEAGHRYEDRICTVCGKVKPQPGDLDCDGRRTIADVSRLYAHTIGTVLLDTDSLPYADVNGDGNVDIADTARLYAHVKGTNPLN